MRKWLLVGLVWTVLGGLAQADNLAWKRIASSSADSPTNSAQAAVDGRSDTEWTSGPSGDQYLYVDLDAPCRIRAVDLHWGADTAPHAIQVSMDAGHWRTVAQSSAGGREHLAIDPQVTRYVRIWLPRLDHAVEIADFEVQGTCSMRRPPYVGQTFPRLPKRPAEEPTTQLDGRLILDRGWELAQDVPDDQAIRPDLDTSTWYDATVPGTVLTTLVNEHVLPEPLYGLNNRRIDESWNQSTWWYREAFELPTAWQGRHVWLDFDGINWKADVYLNGQPVGNMAGAFTRGHFDVTAAAHAGRNVLAVKIHPNRTPGFPLEQTVTAGTGANGGKLGADNPTFHATVGWDWIPGIRDRSIGIWQPVSLHATGPATVSDPQVVTQLSLPSLDQATLLVRADVSNVSQQPLEGTLTASLDDNTSFSVPVSLAAGEHRTVAFPAQTMEHPRLWWPNGYGPQNLYTLRLRLQSFDGDLWDSTQTHFGVRQMGYDDHGHELVITVNGHAIMCKGGNWGMDDAMKRLPHKRMEAFVRMHHLAHVTMIRNWIGMDTEEDFYDECDRYGILVWNDFWLANPVDGPDPDDPDMFLANAADTIRHYRNHPCIALWCGRNEGDPPPVIQQGLQHLTADLDGTRRYQTGSDRQGVHGHGPYCYQDPARYFAKLAHGFTTEIGLPSVPSVESLLHTMPLQDLWPINDTWAYHDFTHGAQNPHTYLAAMNTRYGPATDVDDFCRKAQMLNYDDYRAIFEAWNHKLWKDCSGVLLWMSHPAWPSTVWQLYDYDLEPTAALYGTQKGCEPIHVQLNLDDDSVSVINNTFADLPQVQVVTDLYRLDGRAFWHHVATTTATQNACSNADALPRQGLPAAYFVHLGLYSKSGQLLSDNFYWHAAHEQDLQALNRIPEVALHGRVTAEQGADGTVTVTTVLHNTSPHVAVMTMLTLRQATSGRRVLPAFCSENFVSLLPGEVRTITIDCAADDLAGEAPCVSLQGWNIRRTILPLSNAVGSR